ncbi:MAG: cytochrome c family protein [Pseudomonadota bacterium]
MSLELNKIAAAVLTGGIVAMVSGFVAGKLYQPETLEKPVYVVALPDDSQQTAPEAPVEESILPLLASADVEAGKAATRACAACHSFDKGGANGVGPNLWNLVGSMPAHVDDYAFSDAIQKLASEGKVWNYENLDHFLRAPKEYAPGTKMAYAGMRRIGQRADLIAYMRTLSDDPVALPTAEEAAAANKQDEAAAAPADTGSDTAAATTTESAAPAEASTTAAAAEPAASEATTSTTAAATTEPAETTTTAAAEPAASEEAAKPAETTETAAATTTEAAKPAEDTQTAAAATTEPAKPEETTETAAAATTEAAKPEEATEPAAAATTAAAAPAAAAPSAEDSALGKQIAAADVAKGQRIARQCTACHTFEQGGGNRVGPNLYGVIGKPAGEGEDYNWSQAMADKGKAGLTWTYKNLYDYLENPRQFVPGTKMAYPGLRKTEDRADVIAYIRSLDPNSPPLP